MLFCGTNVVLWDKCYFVGRYVVLWEVMWFCGRICYSQFMVWQKLNFSGERKWGAWGHSGGVQSLWSGWRRVFSCLKFDQKRYMGSFLKWQLTIMWLFRFITCEELNHVMSTLGERLSRSDLYFMTIIKDDN